MIRLGLMYRKGIILLTAYCIVLSMLSADPPGWTEDRRIVFLPLGSWNPRADCWGDTVHLVWQQGVYGGGPEIYVNTVLLGCGKESDKPSLFITTNGGERWYERGLSGENVFDFAYHPTDPQIILAVTTGDPNVPTTGHIYRSSDGGNNWISVQGNDDFFSGISASQMVAYAGSQNGIYKSTNAGLDWNFLPNSPPGPVKDLAVDPINPQIVYAATEWDGIYLTSDGGNTWEKRDNPVTDQFQIVVTHPTTSGLTIVGGGIIFRSDDYGQSYTEIVKGSNSKASPISRLKVHTSTP